MISGKDTNNLEKKVTRDIFLHLQFFYCFLSFSHASFFCFSFFFRSLNYFLVLLLLPECHLLCIFFFLSLFFFHFEIRFSYFLSLSILSPSHSFFFTPISIQKTQCKNESTLGRMDLWIFHASHLSCPDLTREIEFNNDGIFQWCDKWQWGDQRRRI